MSKKILWLRISYWMGALVDGFAALQMIFPDLFAMSYQLANFSPGLDWSTPRGEALH